MTIPTARRPLTAERLFELLGLPVDTLSTIYQSESDWEFIITTDALLEICVKEVVKNCLTLQRFEGTDIGEEALDDFVDTLPINGRTSLISLLRASGCRKDHVEIIEIVRRLRNGFAHNIRLIDSSMLEL